MLVYKITHSGMTANHGNGNYQLQIGKNVTQSAKCAHTGFHAAENPLDCFNYYCPNEKNEYFLCLASGDIDEDSSDSKISCTELTVVRQLNLTEFIAAAVLYIRKYPNRELNNLVKKHCGTAVSGFVVVYGENPKAAGNCIGDVLGLCKKCEDGSVSVNVIVIDDKKYKKGVYYSIDGKPVKK